MFVRVRGGAVAVVLAWGLLLAGCGGDTSPVGTVKLFLKLSNNLNTEQQMHDLLAKQTCQRMKENALQASDHIGGQMGRLKSVDMFLLGLANPPSKVGEVKLQRKQGDRAWVKVVDRKGKHTEVWELVKEEGGWRIILPK